MRRLFLLGLRISLRVGALIAVLVVIFAIFPIPTTAFVLERAVATGHYPDYDWQSGKEISPHLLVAVVAAEDQRFGEHSGFDFDAIEKAAEHNSDGGTVRGASTISQQVAKNLFLWPGRSWIRKGLEVGLTVMIETVWSKRRILDVYVNIAEMGDGVFGAEAAAQRFFDKPASALTPREAALLAAVLPNPRLLRADKPSAYVRRRQEWILRQMTQLGGADWLKNLNASRWASVPP